MADLDELISALSDPSAYPDAPKKIQVEQTESSVLFMTKDRVYKLKKPLTVGIQNYSTPARRRRMCNLEVELGQRLSPNLYYGVRKVTRRSDGYTFDGRGKVVDYVVEMRRLDDKKRLDRLILADKAGEKELRAIALKLADFHRSSERRQLVSSFSRPHILARQWNRRLRRSAELVGTMMSVQAYTDIVTYASNYLGAHRSTLQSRIDMGHIVEGHGELIAEHIYLDNGIQIIDPVEYNDRRRYGDVAFDLAALVVSLDAIAAPDLARVLVDEYENASGDDLSEVLAFYLCFRAHDWGLEAGIRARASNISIAEHNQLAQAARRYFRLAHRYARGDEQPLMLIMSGISGAGKTTLAKALADVVAARYLQAGEAAERFATDDPNKERRGVEKAYEELFEQARDHLARGRSVVLDAAFHNSTYRVAARTLAADCKAVFLVVECDAPEEVVRERVRQEAGDGLRLHRNQKKAFQPSREIYLKDKVHIDTTAPVEDQIETVLTEL